VATTAAGGTPTPALSVADLAALGVTGVTADNLPAVRAAIAATADDGTGVDTLAELQAVVTTAANDAAAALAIISAYTGANTVPTTATYAAAGVSGVSAGSLSAINSAVALLSAAVTDTSGEVQAVVDAYLAILAEANGTDPDATPGVNPTAAQYTAIGATIAGGLSGSGLALLNDAVGAMDTTRVDTVAEIESIAGMAGRVLTTAAGGTPTPALSVADLVGLGVTGVTADNLPAVRAAIAATVDDGSGVDTLAELQTVVSTAAGDAAAALARLRDYTGTGVAPPLSDYVTAGVQGVTTDTLGAMNSALAVLGAPATDTVVEIQAVVNAYLAILEEANGAADDPIPASDPTSAHYGLIGAAAAAGLSPAALDLLNDRVGNLTPAGVDTVAEIEGLAAATARVLATAAGTSPSPALSEGDLALLGVTGATTDLMPAVRRAVAATADSGSGVDTIGELQAVVSAAVAAASDALGQLRDYAGSGAAPTLATYENAGVSGVTPDILAAVNAALAVLPASASDTVAEVQAVVDAYTAILAEANGPAPDPTPTSDPSGAQYTAVGATAAGALTPAGLALLNEVLGNQVASAIDTPAEIDAFAGVIGLVMTTAAGGTPTPALSAADLEVLGVTGVVSGFIDAYRAAIARTADDGTGVDSLTELQALVTQVNDAFARLRTYDGTNAVPTLPDYQQVNVSGVEASNLAAMNSALAVLVPDDSDSTVELQLMVTSYRIILAEANGSDADLTPGDDPTPVHYSAIGATTAAGLSPVGHELLNDAIKGLSSPAVDSVGEVNGLASAVTRVLTTAANGTPVPLLSAADLTSLGVSGVTADNILAVRAAIAATADNGSGVATIGAIQTLVNALTTALARLTAYDGSGAAPTQGDYDAAGVTGVTAGTLGALNNALAVLTPAASDTVAEVQAMVEAYTAILAEANGPGPGNPDPTPTTDPTAAQYGAVGASVAAALSTSGLGLLNDVLGELVATDVDTVAELEALAGVAGRVMTTAAGGTPTPVLGLSDFTALGITGATAETLPAIRAAIAATADSGTGVDSLAKLQGVVSGAVSSATTALAQLRDYAGGVPAPTVDTYQMAGVSGVDTTRLPSMNSALAVVPAELTDTVGEIQAIVDTYLRVLAEANGVAPDATPGVNPTIDDYVRIGVTTATRLSAAGLQLLNEGLGASPTAAVDTVAELRLLEEAAACVMATAAGDTSGPALGVAGLVSLGVQGPSADILPAIRAAIAATADDGTGVDTVAELQAIVNAIYEAIARLSRYDGSQTAPTLNDYAQAGVAGVTASLHASVNSALAAVGELPSDTLSELQAITDAYARILAEANGVEPDATPGVNPTATQYGAIGASVASALNAPALALLNDVVATSLPTAVDTVPELNAIAATTGRVMATAAGQTPVPGLGLDDFTRLGVTGVTSTNLTTVIGLIEATDNSGVGVNTVVKIQSLVNTLNPAGVRLTAVARNEVNSPVTINVEIIDIQGQPAQLVTDVRFRLVSSDPAGTFVPTSPMMLPAGTRTASLTYQGSSVGDHDIQMLWLVGDTVAGDRTHGTIRLALSRRSQTILVTAVETQGLGTQTVPLSASATSGLAVSFVSQTPTVCTVQGTGVVLRAVGTCAVRATQVGNDTWNSVQADTSFDVVTPTMTWARAQTDIPGAGGEASVALTVSPLNTGWVASSSATWLTTTASGTGSTSVVLRAATNDTTTRRTATVTVGGATHTVTQDPTRQLRLRVAEVRGSRVTLQWTYVGPQTAGFVLEGDIVPGGRGYTFPQGSVTMVTFDNVGPGRYFARMRLVEDVNALSPSNEVPVLVGQPDAPSAPGAPLVLVSGDTVTLNWATNFGGGEPTSQQLVVTGSFNGSLDIGLREGATYGGVPAGTYQVRTRSSNAAGGNVSSGVSTVTVPGACVAPQTPTWVSVGRTGQFVSLRWEPAESGGAATDYYVTAEGLGVYPTGGRRVIGGTVPPGTYRIFVQAVNTCGVSAPSQVFTVTVP